VEIIKNILKKNFLVVANDVGASHFIKSFISHFKISAKYYLKGPAIKVFNKKKINQSLEKTIKRHDIIITGSGWMSNLEKRAIKYSNKYSKLSISFLDSWANYKERFLIDKNFILPSQIWVFDKYAYIIAKKVFFNKNVEIVKKKNYFLSEFKENIKNIKNIKKIKKINNSILYLSSNFNGSNKNFFNNKSDIDLYLFNTFLKKIKKNFRLKKIAAIHIKLHPTEKPFKYQIFKKKFPNLVTILNKKTPLLPLMLQYKIAAGSETFALVLAKICGLKVFNNVKNINIKKTIPKIYIDQII